MDYSGGHITNEEARGLIAALNEELPIRVEGCQIELYPGVSYRNVLVLKSEDYVFEREKEVGGAPPHDIIGARIADELPREEILRTIVLTSREILEGHEINVRRAAENKRKANMVWLWSGGRKPSMPAFSDTYGVSGSVISGVYLVKGVGQCMGLDVIDVPGATGYIDTNYAGKAEYALRSLREQDFVLVHVEAPDEAGHLGDIDLKVKAIEDFDKFVVGKMLRGLEDEFADTGGEKGYKILVMPDHYTPVSVRTHTKEPVPFAIYQSQAESSGKERRGKKACTFDETSAKKGPQLEACDLMPFFFS